MKSFLKTLAVVFPLLRYPQAGKEQLSGGSGDSNYGGTKAAKCKLIHQNLTPELLSYWGYYPHI